MVKRYLVNIEFCPWALQKGHYSVSPPPRYRIIYHHGKLIVENRKKNNKNKLDKFDVNIICHIGRLRAIAM